MGVLQHTEHNIVLAQVEQFADLPGTFWSKTLVQELSKPGITLFPSCKR